MTPVTFTLASLVSVLISFVLPLLVGLVTRASTSGGVKAVLLLLLSAVTAVLTQFASFEGDGFPWATTVLTALVGFVMAVAAHFGLWKPTGTTATVQAIGPHDGV